MNPIIPNKDYPILLFKNFKIPKDHVKEKFINKISEEKGILGPAGSEAQSFQLKFDCENFLFDLYDDFVEISRKHLKKFTISDKNIKRYWAYGTNRFDPHYQWHDHVRTSTINGVYYLRIPKTVTGCELDLSHKDNFFRFFPEENDLLIMPNYLQHAPRQPLCDEYRISVNIEIVCNEDPDDIFIDYIRS
jgi:hypothetical protein